MTRVLIVGAGITGAVTASLLKCRLPHNSHIAIWEMCKQSGWLPLHCLINPNVNQKSKLELCAINFFARINAYYY